MREKEIVSDWTEKQSVLAYSTTHRKNALPTHQNALLVTVVTTTHTRAMGNVQQMQHMPSTDDRHELSMTYGHRTRLMRLGAGQYVWLANPSVVLTPDPIGSHWKDVVYWLSAFGFLAAIVTVGLSTRHENCSPEPGPCFFNFISHWYYIWYNLMFFVWAFSRHWALARWFACVTHWFNFGTAWLWAIMTTILVISTTRATIEELLPLDDDAQVGLYVFGLLVLHYWPLAVMLWFNGQYGEVIAAFWARSISWLSMVLTYAFVTLVLFCAIWSPLIPWAVYVLIFNPFDVYNITPQFARDYLVPYFVAIGTVMISGFALGAYLDSKLRALIHRRCAEYGEHVHHTSDQDRLRRSSPSGGGGGNTTTATFRAQQPAYYVLTTSTDQPQRVIVRKAAAAVAEPPEPP